MELFQKNTTTFKKLLAKRQNPYIQIFKSQPSDPTNQPKSQVNLPKKVNSSQRTTKSSNSSPQFPSNSCNLFHHPPQKNISKSQKTPLLIPTDPKETFEKVTKKVKFSPEVLSSRKSSYDEEKEVSDHSTTCETHSEGIPAMEVLDLIWSPVLISKSPREPHLLVLDETETSPQISNLYNSFTPSDQSLNSRKVQTRAEKLGGRCLPSLCLSEGKYKLECKLRHQWESTMEELEKRWCFKCENMLKKCKAFAKKNGGVCLNEFYDDEITFECSKKHQWKTMSKCYDNKWCQECVKEEKEYFKKKCEEERKRREKIEEEYQRKLFEEARRRVTENAMINEQPQKEDVLVYFQKIDREVELLAQKETEKYMANKDENVQVTLQQVMQINKVLITPEEILQKYMMNLNQDLLKSEFRRMAKILHPDKNGHPMAGNAFQKIYRVYEVVIGRFAGGQNI